MVFEEQLENPVVQRYLHDIVGPEGMELAVQPPEGEVTDEELAEQLDMELNVVRRTLMLLDEENLASYRRERDQDSGWLTYLWTFKYENIPSKMAEDMYRLRDALEERMEYESSNQFYLCDICQLRFGFEEAMEMEFECPECGSDMNSIDSHEMVEAMRQRIVAIEEELPPRDTL